MRLNHIFINQVIEFFVCVKIKQVFQFRSFFERLYRKRPQDIPKMKFVVL